MIAEIHYDNREKSSVSRLTLKNKNTQRLINKQCCEQSTINIAPVKQVSDDIFIFSWLLQKCIVKDMLWKKQKQNYKLQF